MMKYTKRILAIATLLFGMALCSMAQVTVLDTIFDRAKYEDTFAFGADISWLSQQESWKTVYRNRAGKADDLMTILQEEEGINAVRFRVWVNPSGGWSGKQDVINLCKRAADKGLKIMIDFHYSDTWADPGSQTIPAAWTDTSVEALSKNVYDHTYDILNSLKKLNIHPKWVQIGNETKRGMLWETGRTNSTQGYINFATLINSAYKAIKEVDENILAIVHLPDGHDNSLYRSMFDNLKKHGAKWDVIGMSAYPRWSHLDITTDANVTAAINKYMTNIRDMKSRYGTPVMIVETGHYNNAPIDANHFLAEFMKTLTKEGVLGCFYWEPEAMSGYDLGAWDPNTHQASIAMDAYKGIKHVQVSKYFTTAKLMSPIEPFISEDGKNIALKVRAKTGNTVTTVSKVEFFLNGESCGVETTGNLLGDYTVLPEVLETGAYTFHAVIRDNQGHEQNTDTVSFIVGPALMLDEDSPVWNGFDEGKGVVQSTFRNYTGTGYMNSDDEKGVVTSWNINFPVEGTYTLAFRYSTTEAKTSGHLFVDDVLKLIISYPSTDALYKWKMNTKSLKITEPGVHKISLRSVYAAGLPNIDYIALFSPDATNPATEAVGISSISAESDTDSGYYNLMGQKVDSPTTGGIYIHNGKKVLIKR